VQSQDLGSDGSDNIIPPRPVNPSPGAREDREQDEKSTFLFDTAAAMLQSAEQAPTLHDQGARPSGFEDGGEHYTVATTLEDIDEDSETVSGHAGVSLRSQTIRLRGTAPASPATSRSVLPLLSPGGLFSPGEQGTVNLSYDTFELSTVEAEQPFTEEVKALPPPLSHQHPASWHSTWALQKVRPCFVHSFNKDSVALLGEIVRGCSQSSGLAFHLHMFNLLPNLLQGGDPPRPAEDVYLSQVVDRTRGGASGEGLDDLQLSAIYADAPLAPLPEDSMDVFVTALESRAMGTTADDSADEAQALEAGPSLVVPFSYTSSSTLSTTSSEGQSRPPTPPMQHRGEDLPPRDAATDL
jgi:hypothetical protein